MAKDYFEDIVPPANSGAPRTPPARPIPEAQQPAEISADDLGTGADASPVPIHVDSRPPAVRSSEATRGIRNISAPSRPPARTPRIGADMREAPPISGALPPRHRGRSHLWIWAAAIVSLFVLGSLIFFFAFRSTTVTVTPKSHTIVLTNSSQFTAYPAAIAASGTLSYTVQTFDFDDSDVVEAQGTTTAPAAKASGNITVFNSYSAAPVKLIKNTRFQTPDGLVFRTPADVVVPGKTASAPGQVQVTVVADAVGSQYNVAPVARFSLPGLTSNADMYAHVYAKSSAAMSGGSSGGDAPGIAPAALSAAISDVRGRLEAKARAAVLAQSSPDTSVFLGLMQVAYTSEPNTTEAGGGVRIHENAHVAVPVFPAVAFAQTVGQSSVADANTAALTLIPGSNFAATMAASSTPVLGTDPIDFSLSGNAELVWNVDTAALAQALAGRDQGAFQTIVNGFEGVQEAHARIEPFWKTTFPAKAADIVVSVSAPASAQ